MANSQPRITYANPTWSRWTGAVATDPTAGTEIPNVEEVDMGTVVAGANSEAKAVTLEFPADFDDSVYGVRVWLLNKRRLTGVEWYGEFSSTALFPAGTLVTALTNGVIIPTRPDLASYITTPSMYNSANKRIRNMLVQIQTQVGAQTIKQQNAADGAMSAPPCLMVDFERKTRADEDNLLMLNDFNLDRETKNMYMFSDVNLYVADNYGNYHLLAAIKEDTVDIDMATTRIEWKKGKPKVTDIEALSDQMFTVKFKLDELNMPLWAEAVDQSLTRNSATHTVDLDFSGQTRPVKERAYMVEATTIGGFKAYWTMDRATVSAGNFKPGENDFAGREFTLKALASGCNRRVARLSVTDVPVETACCLQLPYIIA